MKKEKLSFLVLIVEIAAIVFLHSAKNKQNTDDNLAQEVKQMPSTYQLQAMPLTKLK